jgi:mono/diheme cytochrome c family protein
LGVHCSEPDVKRFLKWTAISILGIIVVAALAVLVVSEYRLRQKFDIAAAPIVVATDSGVLARGRHLYVTRGCEGCHGPELAGKVFLDDPMLARLVAPNVPQTIRAYSDADVARLLRHGVRPNGRGVAVMPSAMLYNLDDADVGALIAYLRTIPVKEAAEPLPSTFMGPLARLGLTIGQYSLEPATIDHDAPRVPNGPDAVGRGEYTAMTSCVECHGQRLEGRAKTPALSIVAGYTAAEFAKLMREGVPRDGRKLDLMARSALGRFANFTDEEVAELYAFLSRQVATAPRGS